MKDYKKIYRLQDKKYVEDLYKRVKYMQNNRSYPLEFEMPITLQFELLSECNLYCKHCYNQSGEKENQSAMKAEDWKRLARNIVENGGIFQCILSGGEPLLIGDDLFDIMDILHDDGTSFVIITNGYLLNKEKVKRLLKYRYYWLQVSIDGDCANFHDDFRQVKGSWERAVSGAFEVSNSGIPLVVAHTVTPATIDRVPKMADLAYQLGATSLMLGQVLPSGRANRYLDEILLDAEQENYMYEQIENIRKEYGGRLEIQRASTLKNQLDRYKIGPNIGAIVRPNGDVRLDCMAPFVIGNVLETPLEDIWKRKGKNIWKNEQVLKFINSVDDEKQFGDIVNYIDPDIHL